MCCSHLSSFGRVFGRDPRLPLTLAAESMVYMANFPDTKGTTITSPAFLSVEFSFLATVSQEAVLTVFQYCVMSSFFSCR